MRLYAQSGIFVCLSSQPCPLVYEGHSADARMAKAGSESLIHSELRPCKIALQVPQDRPCNPQDEPRGPPRGGFREPRSPSRDFGRMLQRGSLPLPAADSQSWGRPPFREGPPAHRGGFSRRFGPEFSLHLLVYFKRYERRVVMSLEAGVRILVASDCCCCRPCCCKD